MNVIYKGHDCCFSLGLTRLHMPSRTVDSLTLFLTDMEMLYLTTRLLQFPTDSRKVRYIGLRPRVGFGAHVCYHCRISPPRFLAECRKRRLNQGSFVLLYFRSSTLFDLYLVFVCLFSCIVFVFSFGMSIFLYSYVCQYQSSHWL